MKRQLFGKNKQPNKKPHTNPQETGSVAKHYYSERERERVCCVCDGGCGLPLGRGESVPCESGYLIVRV